MREGETLLGCVIANGREDSSSQRWYEERRERDRRMLFTSAIIDYKREREESDCELVEQKAKCVLSFAFYVDSSTVNDTSPDSIMISGHVYSSKVRQKQVALVICGQ